MNPSLTLISTAVQGLLAARAELTVDPDLQLAHTVLILVAELTERYSVDHFTDEELALIRETAVLAGDLLTTYDTGEFE